MARRKVSVRPGKGQSVLGLAVGILFCLLGLFVVVPGFGPFGLVWTAVAVAITVQHGLNVFTEKGAPTHTVEIEDDDLTGRGYSAAPADGSDPQQAADAVRVRLDAARQLYESGAITREEYDRKRAEILAQL